MNLFLCRWSPGRSSKACDVFFRTKTSIEHVLQHFSIFFIPFKAAMYPSFKGKKGCSSSRVWSLYIPLPRPLLSFDQLTFPLNHSKQPRFEKGKCLLDCLVGLYLLGPSLCDSNKTCHSAAYCQCMCVCVCVFVSVCVSVRQGDSEGGISVWLSDKIVSEYSHRGSIRTKAHTHAHTHAQQSRDLLDGRQSSAFFPS